ncbi:hypothetical protein LQZ21_09045 [Treponema sp. TIM-1]|uniref:hypothetical protein n=1 Tax=Treponema sp. TIM-1 TaxID=2898417 RepID=UPI00397EF1FC
MIITIPNPIICKTREEKEALLKKREKEERKKLSKRIPWECFAIVDPPWTPLPDIVTMDEFIEANSDGEFFPELLPSYYIKSDGNDCSDGRSKDTAFKTLSKAVEAAKTGIKRITILDILTDESEKAGDPESVFIIKNSGPECITISGYVCSAFRRTISWGDTGLSAKQTHKRVLKITGNSHIRLLYITISDGNMDASDGGGILLEGGSLILGKETRVMDNYAKKGGGIAVDKKGVLKMMSYDKNIGASIIRNHAQYNGGGVLVYNMGQFELVDGVISENKSTEFGGGGVYIGDVYGSFYMRGGIITTNKADHAGGGVTVSHEGYFEMTGGRILSNTAGFGGGLYIDGGSGKFMNGIISGNRAQWFGGGVYIQHQRDDLPVPSLEMSGGVIIGNTAFYSGGGIEVSCRQKTESVHLTVSSGIISGNIAEKDRGGGIYMYGGNGLITGNAVLCGNMAREYGGGVYIGKGFILDIIGNFILEGNAIISANIVGTDVIPQCEKEHTVLINGEAVTLDLPQAAAWGGGICIADADVDMRGGAIKANMANKGGGVFVASPEEIKKMDGSVDGSCARPGVSARFTQSGGEISGNLMDDIYQGQ